MNDRMTIAAMAIPGMLTHHWADDTPEVVAKKAVAYADAPLKALAESEAEAPGHHDEVGDWREYVPPGAESSVVKVSARDMAYVDNAFIWRRTPQGFEFWKAIAMGNANARMITRAQDFARRVLEAMEASDG